MRGGRVDGKAVGSWFASTSSSKLNGRGGGTPSGSGCARQPRAQVEKRSTGEIEGGIRQESVPQRQSPVCGAWWLLCLD